MSKAEKVSSAIEFWIFELVLVPNFILTDNFDFLDCIFPKRYFQSRTEKVNITIEFGIFKLV